MKCLWCDTDGRRNRKKGAGRCRTCREQTVWTGWDMVCHGVALGWLGVGTVGGKEEGAVSINDRGVILTVGHTLILDLQVLVGPWTGVREDV